MIKAGPGKNLVADRLPRRSGVDQKTAMGMGREDQLILGELGERVPMPRRYRQATLRIESERCCALKHDSPTSSPGRAGKTHFLPLSST
jgi:hypothetical protein